MSSEKDFLRDSASAPHNSAPHNGAPDSRVTQFSATQLSPSQAWISEIDSPFTSQIMEAQLAASQQLVATSTKGEFRARKIFIECAVVAGIGILLALVLHMFVTQVYAISGQSMEPTFHDGEKVIMHKLSPAIMELDRFDVVIFKSPHHDNKNLIKRVIGLPGDVIAIQEGIVYLNGKRLDEDYIVHDLKRYSYDIDSETVPEGHIFVMGDNRPSSQDSRHFRSIPIESVQGEVFAIIWPFDAMSSLP